MRINIITKYNDIILTSYVETVWLGGTDVGTEGRWVWECDRSTFTYSAWDIAKGQPNNYDNQDCLSRLSSVQPNMVWREIRNKISIQLRKREFSRYIDDIFSCFLQRLFKKKNPNALFLSHWWLCRLAFNIDMYIKSGGQTIGLLKK